MTLMHSQWPAQPGPAMPSGATGPADAPPEHEVRWVDPVTGTEGFLVVHRLVGGIATGGTRMRAGCTIDEVGDLARGMALKTATFGLPVGGAKGGIDLDPKHPDAVGVLTRYCEAMRPWLDASWVTAEDLGVSQERIDEVFALLGLGQSYHAAIMRSPQPEVTLRRVQEGLESRTDDGLLVGEVIGGYGVAQACLGAVAGLGMAPSSATVTVQGVGTMGGAAAWYLHEVGVRVVAVADAAGTLHDPEGLDIPALLELRDDYGEIDRARLPEGVREAPRDAIVSIAADAFVPAAVSYAINPGNVDQVAARVVVEAANTATTSPAEAALTLRGIPVIPDFVANAGAAAWAWWLLQGQVGTDPRDSFVRLRDEMLELVAELVGAWNVDHIAPRVTARSIAARRESELGGATLVVP